MERQLVRKDAVTGKPQSRSSNSDALANSDHRQPNQSLLVTTARRIGSVVGKIIAKAENSLSPRKPRIQLEPKTQSRARKASPKRRTIATAPEKTHVAKPVLKTPLEERSDSASRSPLKNVKRKPRTKSLAARNARSDQA